MGNWGGEGRVFRFTEDGVRAGESCTCSERTGEVGVEGGLGEAESPRQPQPGPRGTRSAPHRLLSCPATAAKHVLGTNYVTLAVALGKSPPCPVPPFLQLQEKGVSEIVSKLSCDVIGGPRMIQKGSERAEGESACHLGLS